MTGTTRTSKPHEMVRDSRSQMIRLQVLGQRKAVTVSETAAIMDIAVPTTSTMVRRMVEKGLLVRNRDQEDWRSVRIALSPAGIKFLQTMTCRRAKAAEILPILSEKASGQK